ncbi:hypothetical protein IF1G_06912 [Cordyceps javanica]|uniref:Uncharacterized protein n=1 Tax=Cordyceps javanica TaxID=43265 RepID=A0A545UX37_9HYPO|nr:hypothetical protein IF1G_06912 [Cordyceps javanica]
MQTRWNGERLSDRPRTVVDSNDSKTRPNPEPFFSSSLSSRPRTWLPPPEHFYHMSKNIGEGGGGLAAHPQLLNSGADAK